MSLGSSAIADGFFQYPDRRDPSGDAYIVYAVSLRGVTASAASTISHINRNRESKSLTQTMAGCYCTSTEVKNTGGEMLTLAIALSLAKPTDPMALPAPMDPMCSSFFSDSHSSYPDDWFQSTYFNSRKSGNHDYLVLAQNVPLDDRLYAESDIIGSWRSDDMFRSPPKDFLNNPPIPSPCEGPDNPSINTDRQPLTPIEELSIKQYSPESQAPPKRKRGRPRLVRTDSEESTSRKQRLSKRQPHIEVERKYRESLNAELERLRMAIPTLSNLDSQLLQNPAKLSKATVLSSATEYIRKMELERDRLRQENDILKVARGISTGQGRETNGR